MFSLAALFAPRAPHTLFSRCAFLTHTPPPLPAPRIRIFDRSYEQAIQSGKHPAFLKFYAPWCKHCKKLAPAWNKLAKLEGLASGDLESANAGEAIIGAVDCDDYVGSELCEKFDVNTFPHLMYFSQATGPEGKKYTGERDLTTLREFVMTEFKDGLECGPGHEQLCTEEEKAYLNLARLQTDALLESGIVEKRAALETLTKEYNTAVDNLTEAYEGGMNDLEKEMAGVMREIYILKSFLPGGSRHADTMDPFSPEAKLEL